MGINWAEHTIEIAAPVGTCFEAITDYESFPGWQNAVDRVEVIDRTDDGLGRRVRLFVDAKVRKIDYVLEYRYSPPARIEWDFVEGNGMRDVDGVYTLEEAGPGRTRATYKLGADPEIPVPGPVARRVHRQLVKRSVEDLRDEAERRAAEAPGPQADAAEAPLASEPAARAPTESGGAGEGAAGSWRPLADRQAPGGGEPPDAEPGLAAATSLPGALVGRALSLGQEAADAALRFTRGAAETAFDIGRDVAERVDRRLSGRDKDR